MTQANYYTILGLPLNASETLIKATYRALLKIYHPDVFQGDKKFATEQLKKINEAYETLSDKRAKKKYDEELNQENDSGKAEEEDFDGQGSSNESELYQKIIKEEWDFAVEFYPELASSHEELQKYSKQLAFLFQTILVENKAFESYRSTEIELRNKFLTSKYGENSELIEFAQLLIEDGHKDIAIRIYKQLKRLGESSTIRILEKLADDEPVISAGYRSQFRELDIDVPLTSDEIKSKAFEERPALTKGDLSWGLRVIGLTIAALGIIMLAIEASLGAGIILLVGAGVTWLGLNKR